jgi:hypothetical protein
MSSSWQTETGHLLCRWSEVGKPLQYNPKWMQDASTSQGSYFEPLPSFTRHSPFGGASWFEPRQTDRDCD